MAIKAKIIQKGGYVEEKTLTPLKAIREKCKECCGWDTAEIRKCLITDCALYAYRLGKSGNTKKMTEEARKTAAERLQKRRSANIDS